MKSRKHSRHYSPQSSTQLHEAAGPVLKQHHSIIKLDQTQAIVRGQVGSKAFNRFAKVFKIPGD